MTEERIVQFYREAKQMEPLDEDGMEILEGIKDWIVAGCIINEGEIPDLSNLSLFHSYIRDMNTPGKRKLILHASNYIHVCIKLELFDRYDSPGIARLEEWDGVDKDKIDKLLLEIGEIQEQIDKRAQRWKKFKEGN